MFKRINRIFSKKNRLSPNRKVAITLAALFVFRFGNTIPLSGLDQDALKRSFSQLESRSAIMQIVNMYSGTSSSSVLNAFSLGIIPFINASILIDILTTLIPALEKLQSEEGEYGRRQLAYYKKILTALFAIGQSGVVIFYLQPYFYNSSFSSIFVTGFQLTTGSLIIVWLSNLIDNKGVGSGTSLLIFTNIMFGLGNIKFSNFSPTLVLEIGFLFLICALIVSTQTSRMNIELVSARQLNYLQKNEQKLGSEQTFEEFKNGLVLKLNQAGIFPVIIASNLLGFLSYFTQVIANYLPFFNNILYYVLIIGFNYFYTIVFWDPDKISEQLRKASVSLVGITPGKKTAEQLEKKVRSTSLLGGLYLCFILLLYESVKQILNGALLNQLNVTSLIILFGVIYEVQRTINSLYKNLVFA